jgi:hypothetical protein
MDKKIYILMILAIFVISSCTIPIEDTTTDPDVECLYDSDCELNEICTSNECVDREEEKPFDEIVDQIEEEIKETEEETEEPIPTDKGYRMAEGESLAIMGNVVTFDNIYYPDDITLIVDGFVQKIKGTKNEEIIEDLRISIETIEQKENGIENVIYLNVEEFSLDTNEYRINMNTRIEIGDKEVILKESKKTGHIFVSVYDGSSLKGETYIKVDPLKTKEINGLLITNLENFYKTTKYAIIEAESI